jgi:hypothetical protein
MRYLNYLYTPLVDDAGTPVLLNLSGTNTLRLQIAGTTAQDNRKTLLNYLVFVQVPFKVLSSTSVTGPYAEESGASINTSARTITVPITGGTRFYRLASSTPLSITGISVSGNSVTLTY